MVAKNDITHDLIKTKACSRLYDEGWDRVFKNKPTKEQQEALDDLAKVTEELGLYEERV